MLFLQEKFLIAAFFQPLTVPVYFFIILNSFETSDSGIA